MAFVDACDQFIALMGPRKMPPDEGRHFGLGVDDKEAVKAALERQGVEISSGRFLDFRDPWGNLVQIVQYDEVQFAKTEPALRALGLAGLGKGEAAESEIREKGLL